MQIDYFLLSNGVSCTALEIIYNLISPRRNALICFERSRFIFEYLAIFFAQISLIHKKTHNCVRINI